MIAIYTFVYLLYGCTFLALLFTSSFGRHYGIGGHCIHSLLLLFEYGEEHLQRRKKSLPVIAHNLEDSFDTPEVEYLHKEFLSFGHSIIPNSKKGKSFSLEDIFYYINFGAASIVEDSVLPSFESEELPYWNLLSRTNKTSGYLSVRLTIFWIVGIYVRYFIFLPVRVLIFLVGLCCLFLSSVLLGILPEGNVKRRINKKLSTFCFDILSCSVSLVAFFHNRENLPGSGIAVANHTSPIDSVILATDNCYDMVGQKHQGLLGILMNILGKSSTHIWFERSEAKDRESVAKRLYEHVSNKELPPVLIFPEGVCVNNTTVMQFKKGAFEVDTDIYPIAIRFDPRFGDPFWWQDHFFYYILYMMTSWAIVCDVWYLPPMRKTSNESASDFAERVKTAIAHRGGFQNVSWDGFLKLIPPKEECKKFQQLQYAKQLLDENTNAEESAEDCFIDKRINA